MKKIENTKKNNFFKKILIKLCRLLGYELIDQSSLEYPVSNKKNTDSLSIPGKLSYSLGVGAISITRKVKAIDIIVKTCTKVQLVTQNKKRIFEKQKSEYTFRSLKSLINSALDLKKKFPDILINFKIIDIGSEKSDKDKLRKFINEFPNIFIDLDEKKIEIAPKTIDKNNPNIENNMANTMKSIYESFQEAKKSNDLIYFVEDDYIHKKDALAEMVFAYEKFSSIFKEELFLLSTDYPYLYKKLDNSSILTGENYHWRSVKESLLTFMTSKNMIDKHFETLQNMAKIESDPFEKNLHKLYEDELCLSPLPSLSIHCTNVNSIFGISPNVEVKKIWDDNKV